MSSRTRMTRPGNTSVGPHWTDKEIAIVAGLLSRTIDDTIVALWDAGYDRTYQAVSTRRGMLRSRAKISEGRQ